LQACNDPLNGGIHVFATIGADQALYVTTSSGNVLVIGE
jgi:hypothetical protein